MRLVYTQAQLMIKVVLKAACIEDSLFCLYCLCTHVLASATPQLAHAPDPPSRMQCLDVLHAPEHHLQEDLPSTSSGLPYLLLEAVPVDANSERFVYAVRMRLCLSMHVQMHVCICTRCSIIH